MIRDLSLWCSQPLGVLVLVSKSTLQKELARPVFCIFVVLTITGFVYETFNSLDYSNSVLLIPPLWWFAIISTLCYILVLLFISNLKIIFVSNFSIKIMPFKYFCSAVMINCVKFSFSWKFLHLFDILSLIYRKQYSWL